MIPKNEGRDSKGRFVAGNKGGGRKALSGDVKAMFKAATVGAVQLLIDTMTDVEVKPELRVRCAETIIERVYGKSAQPIEGDLAGGICITLNGEVKDYGG